ncbi:DUF4329 domain-containing protein [Mitsuaria sp. CC2]|uniref:DUF4329 domain-containing protein n=1 Tax=Mitsuaria sp. CC2 TaxID=3029186 RepID=UPI003B8DC55D
MAQGHGAARDHRRRAGRDVVGKGGQDTSLSNPSRNLGYDAAGNTLTDTGSGYTTDRLDNRMGTLTKGGVTLTYRYDAGGQRVHKEHSQGMRYFAYDLDGKMLGEYNATSPVHEFVWLGDTPVAVMTGSGPEPTILYVYADHLNAPRMLIDKADALRWRWLSEPFGTATPEQAPAGLAQVVFNLRFPGQFFDSESGLYYNYFRDYDATLGRYVQSDPIGLAGGIDTYAYVGNSPLQFYDSLGLKPGESFDSVEAAAVDALNYINGRSICENVEYGGWIYKKWGFDNKNSKFTYDEPTRGKSASVPYPSAPAFHEAYSAFHTHAAYDPRFDNESFSDRDKEIGDGLGVPTYLATPGRKIKKYSPDPRRNGRGQVSTIGATPNCECPKK